MLNPELQDSKGRFKKGHKAIITPVKPGEKRGHPKSMETKVRDALQIAEDAMPQLYLDMIRDAQDPNASIRDRQMCREYLSDRIYGRPDQPITGTLNINVWSELVKSAEREAIEEAERIVKEAQE